MDDWAIVALGIPMGVSGIFFGWLLLRQYLKLLTNRDGLKQKSLELQERELLLNERKVDRELGLQEQELEFKFKMLERQSQNEIPE